MENTIKNIDELKKLINDNSDVKFNIKVVANSKVDLIDFCDEYIKIKIKQRAIEGKANKAIIEFLSNELGISKSRISISFGEKSSLKTIRVVK